MFNNVLVGVDGRPTGRDAIALASRLVDPDGQLTLAHVHSGPMRPSHAVTPSLLQEEREASAKLLERERAESDLDAELVSIAGASPGHALHRQAEEQHADLLVVGSCSRGGLGRAMLGDDTRGALDGAPCAIAIAARGYAEHPTPLAKIGVGYDGSPESELALQTARQIAHATGATVDALEVVSLPTYGYTGIIPPLTGVGLDEMLQEASARMEKLPDVHGHAVSGLTGAELAALADTVDLLIVGSRGYGPMKRMMLGSTSTYLQRHVRCSLLVMPHSLISETPDRGQQADPHGAPEPAETHAEVR
jgi:nucleotide-binding universal stress UspA family protein